ncbi:hypothetical protein A2276_01215 [candidate division WOR-1 bacterium RIFOXYA12_FULL_43_27]|uniref:Ligand-binding protein SH3 n=1 Tax=candidate division WOR-1 bacterium RIFOXYC2_FULL_46_14 TaxID=1802587 RepID=A0A1F4U4T9_UNCSA|nr:MAG: hypothetical protein A2276_01215 [candidate division WOR-1 bacterium RIFOXYA12_FULL_43_27]OGC20695.1 MAG: hypothetical protein A2292_06660 [candidate division WOR-1 bacterium RIFOXYB2_FULL_46_45]OGC31568.1 MAG: hypothetical protein A2232_04790 [candidate division WOR-1 bacterium RIFOXYA2_FULL_46_56]OGC39974.1 MAG: hypothetical protein A2438_05635 [candidate division WOR-1 bacterium RIFOXYC2_FULL_46_14]
MFLLELLKGLPKWLIILITSATPVIEVRGAVPLGIAVLKMPAVEVVILSVIGSLIPVFPILWALNTLIEHFRKVSMLDRFIGWLFERTKRKSKIIDDLKLVGLTLFIGIPFPGTGVWTGCVAAYLLGLKPVPTFIAALIGTIIASLLMTAASLGIIHLF